MYPRTAALGGARFSMELGSSPIVEAIGFLPCLREPFHGVGQRSDLRYVHLTLLTAREGTTGEHMVTRMSKTGAIYYEEPFTQAELEERQRSEGKVEPAAKAIALERFEAGRHAFVAVAGDVQIGWCIRRDGGW